ncbi:replication associated protein [Lynx rufus smacovirus 1]|uniref:Replication associated protein n=1 Tax=Lynx rufus smacovirus 1 TaxID=2592414 RepID=A0A513ZT25_9VIRU|nr:replication associated protein [Lynx rufus smacovirus 1]QDH43738.1 replication associated protein [Lynx rufus smacovirus 1]
MANVKWIDAVIWCDGDQSFDGVGDEDEWRQKFSGLFERFAYGRETAPETGRRHFQFRGVLRAPADSGVVDYLSSCGFRHITPTHVRDFEYVYKDKDFYCSWEVYRPEFSDVRDRPQDWMIQVDALPRDGRTIEIIVDPDGRHYKTAWAMYQQYLHKACYCPPFMKGVDLINFVLQARTSDWYILDMPRAFDFTRDWACAIEQVKNGYVYDSRYSFKDKFLPERPRVTLLVNELPDFESYFSSDRVFVFRITPEGYLWSV